MIQLFKKRLITLILFLFSVLIIFVILNSVYSTIRWNMNAIQKVDKELNNKLTIAEAILFNDLDKFRDLSFIIREQSLKFIELLNYDNYRAINIILQTISSLYDVDLILFFDDSDELISSNKFLTEENSEQLYTSLFESGESEGRLEKVSPLMFKSQYPRYYQHNANLPALCFKTVVKLSYDSGDLAGHVVLVKLLNVRKDLIRKIAALSGAEIVFRDYDNQLILTSFPEPVTLLSEDILEYQGKTFFIKFRNLKNRDGESVVQLATAIDSHLFLEQKRHLLISNLFPFLVTVVISLILFLLLKIRIFDKINQLIDVLREVKQGNLQVRVHLGGKKALPQQDEISNMLFNFNTMMDKLEESYTQSNQHRVQLEELNHQLTDEILERKHIENALRDAKKEADAANRAKSIFLANMSHEIRTPLNAILGYAQILQRDASLDKNQRSAINTIERSGNHLLDLINDILDISKIEAGRVELNLVDFNLTDLLRDIDETFKLRCRQKDLYWQIKGIEGYPKIPVHGDQGKLRQVLINLLGNAVKFTDKGSVVLDFSKVSANYYKFAVKDSGAGIPLAAQKSIFNAFQQEQEGLKKGGTGLGLAISKKQIELMGAELLLDSVEGRGACFYFTLELPPAKEDIVIVQERETKKIIGLVKGCYVKALVVDDNQVNRDVLAKILTDVGVEVRVAESGYRALDIVSQYHPNIVFMDYRMPKMDGIETIAELQKRFAALPMKTVIVSASAFQHESKRFKQAGCDGWISKPFHIEDVYRMMESLLGIRYIYEGDSVDNDKSAIDLSAISIPAQLEQPLKESAEFCMITDLDELIQQLVELNQNHATIKLAEYLKELTADYNMDEVLKVLEQVNYE